MAIDPKTDFYLHSIVVRRTCIQILLFVLLFAVQVKASDIIETLPLTRDIIMVHLSDGYAIYHKINRPRIDEKVITVPLQHEIALNINQYRISSADDDVYKSGIAPISIGLKSKGSEFIWLCQGWNGTTGCINSDPDRVLEHWIYLVLPSPMQHGKTYTINTGKVAGNQSSAKLTFDEKTIRSEAVHVNMIGYVPSAPMKYGYVYHWMGDLGGLNLSSFANGNFHLIDIHSHQISFSGKLNFRKSKTNPETGQSSETPNANFIGADVFECDFSDFSAPGEYVLSVEGIGCSFPFRIEPDIYRMPFYTAIRGLYHNRSGIELKEPYTEFIRKAPHNPLTTTGFSGKLRYTTSRFVDWTSGDGDQADKHAIEIADMGPINTWGWYQDAGDWDGYFSHLNIPCMLMFAWEYAQNNFRDNELNIPERDNNIPDILDEASWLLRYYYRTRHEIISRGYGTGGIGSRVFGDLWGSDESPDGTGRGSWQDNTRYWYVSGEDPFTTYKYAALAAQMAFCLKTGGLRDTINWRKEAIEAYDWAKNNTKTGDEGYKPAAGYPLKDIRSFAAASLFRLTGNTEYHDQLKTDAALIASTTYLKEEARWAPYIVASMPDSLNVDPELRTRLTGAVITTADIAASSASTRACRYGGDFYMPMLAGQATTPMVFEVIMGHKVAKHSYPQKAAFYLSCLYTTADYFLGCNPLNTTWITGLGLRQPKRVFHMDSWYNGKKEMAAGITPYGPWRNESTSTGMGPWDLKWPHNSIYPTGINNWPGHERWFSNSTCPMNAEFTVHQNTVLNATLYGILCSDAAPGFVPNRRPRVNLVSPTAGSIQSDTVLLGVDATDPDGDSTIYKVEYYNGWHKIAESYVPPYTCRWNNTVNGNLSLTAIAIDRLGMTGRADTLVAGSITGFTPEFEESIISVNAYPNPFSDNITIEYSITKESIVKLDVFDTTGRLVSTLVSQSQSPASYRFSWNGLDSKRYPLNKGAYICRYETRTISNDEVSRGYLLLIKNY